MCQSSARSLADDTMQQSITDFHYNQPKRSQLSFSASLSAKLAVLLLFMDVQRLFLPTEVSRVVMEMSLHFPGEHYFFFLVEFLAAREHHDRCRRCQENRKKMGARNTDPWVLIVSLQLTTVVYWEVIAEPFNNQYDFIFLHFTSGLRTTVIHQVQRGLKQ